MEEEEWAVQQLEKFAAAYIQHNVLYTNPLSLCTYTSAKKMKQHEQLDKEFALELLAGSLGLPNDHALDQLCSEFRRQLLHYVRGRVRACLFRREHYTSALADSLPNIAQLAKKLNLLVVAVQTELSCKGSPMRCWAVDALITELCGAVRSHYSRLGKGPEDLPSDVLAAAPIAVFSGAKRLTKVLWLRICALRKKQLLKLSLFGDRGDLLRPSERLERIDWQFVDALLMYAPDDTMILAAESLLHWRDLLRALTVLVELLVAARVRRPASCIPLARRTALWRGVHNAYNETGRSATVVLLQRRWQQLLKMARAANRGQCPAHPLLVMVAASFPRVISKTDVAWRTLVRHGLVATTEEVETTSVDDKIILDIDFTQLERCETTNDVVRYITTKLESEHKVYYEDIFLKRQNYFNTVIVDSSENSDCELEDNCNNLKKVTDSCLSLSNTEKGALEKTIYSNDTITLDSDSEVDEIVNEEQNKSRDKATENQQYFEIEIDTSKIVDYIPDVLMEVENFKTLDDLENPLHDSKVKTEPNIEFIKCEDGSASEKLIENSKTEQQLCPASTMLDPKLFSMPRIKLKSVDETEAWRSHARLDSMGVNNYQNSVQAELLELTYLSASSTESDDEVNEADKYCYDKKSNNPDLNPVLKRLSKNFWKKNRKLIKLCRPALVRVGRLRDNELPCGERVVKRVKLPDIDEVLRTNQNILTAQVEPIHGHNHELKRARAARRAVLQSARELVHTPLVAEVMLLHNELEELFALPPPIIDDMLIASKYDDGLETEGAKDYNLRYHDWLRKRQETAPLTPLVHRFPEKTTAGEEVVKKRDQQTIIKDKYLEIDTKNAETEIDEDLDNMLSRTIIKRPMTFADKPETDMATQPFFVSSNEILVASKSGSTTPVITRICSLAEKDVVLVSDDHTLNQTVRRPSHSGRSKPVEEAIRRPSQPSHDIKTTQPVGEPQLVMNGVVNVEDDTVIMTPTSLTIRMNPVQKKQDESSQSSKISLPKKYERFNDPGNELATLTPIIVRGARTSTNTVVPTQNTTTPTFTSGYVNSLLQMRKQSVTTNPLKPHLVPAIVTTQMPTNKLQLVTLMTPSVSNAQRMPVAMTTQMSVKLLQLVPTLTVTAPLTTRMSRTVPGQFQATTMTTPNLSSNTTQPMPTFTMTSPMVMTSQMPVTNQLQIVPALPAMKQALLPVSNDNIMGLHNKMDGEITHDAEQRTMKWVEPGRIERPSALTLNRTLSPKDYITTHGKFNLTVVKLDSSKPMWTVAEEYMILADMNLPCVTPTYWTLGSPENCSQLLWPESVDESTRVNVTEAQEMDASSIVIGNVVGNYPKHEVGEVSNLDCEMKDGEVPVVNVSDSDSDDGQIESTKATTSLLRVKSFAKCERMGTNALELATTGCRDVTKHGDRYFKKLTDDPVRYSLMLTTVLSTQQCDLLLRGRVALHVWNRRTGALDRLDVSENLPDQLPARMAGALLIRHADIRFLKDMACKFQHLNSANALIRKNQVYVFAPPEGTLLVASPDDLNDMEKANWLLQNSGNS